MNVGKLGLGLFSILFDLIVVFQHFILYPPQKDKPEVEDLIEQNIEEESIPQTDTNNIYDSNESSNPELYKISYAKANNLFREYVN